jgi:hypothetical protein
MSQIFVLFKAALFEFLQMIDIPSLRYVREKLKPLIPVAAPKLRRFGAK